MPGIAVEGIGRRFGEVRAVDGFSLSVANGEFVTLLGPSGCGKTTTLRMVAGLERNDSGSISIGARVVSDAAAGVFVQPDLRQLGMVFQSYAIWPHMTVFDNVAFPLRVRRTARAEIERKVMTALQLVEMEGFSNRPAPALSGGQQQRVAIARALVFEPEVLLLDEPLSNLDARLRAQMGDELRALQRRLKITTLYVTHDQGEAMALSDRVVVMRQGRVLQIGLPETVYRRPASREVATFLGAPNLIEAKVTACHPTDQGDYLLSVEGANWRGNCRAGERFDDGDRVVIIVRPEEVRLAAPDQPARAGHIAWSAQIIDGIYRGPHRSIVAQIHGMRINIEAPSTRPVGIGEAVTLSVAADNIWAVRA